MCDECAGAANPGRRNLLRGLLAGTAGATLAATGLGAAVAQAAPGSAGQAGRVSAGVRFRWLGVAGWELSFDGRRVLIDPYLSRFRYTTAAGAVDPSAPLTTNLQHLAPVLDDPAPVELILLTHGHWDHAADVPHLMKALHRKDKNTPRVTGTETHRCLLTALGVDPGRMIDVRGGEYLDFQGFTVRGFRSLHGTGANYQYFAPGTHRTPPPRPTTIGELVEGGTLAYRVDVGDRLSAVFIGTAAFIENELAGQRPDVAVLSLTGGTTYQFVERALVTLGRPRFVVPSHHDRMDTPLGTPGVDPQLLRDFRAVVARISPRSTVIEPDGHLGTFTL
ncbi:MULTISPECIES: MBL fold metallo-hydrolase [unclassified Crossiella]|uniref:MBL fold metallo-hydrolase n=1 Tax=unclassified Crossiella TaxID=2620835 RepID=UPI001FFEBF71|nr:MULTISPECIES: MBL fold metallo-hydrolase [unclassified Crossiella]MCK2242726.1 MBL fold metallo-hydrolase [Crossiella sp. S99.2]MCK2256603.1 MBL fold metallo-hydrolase [Crossiella sp. S99.1]